VQPEILNRICKIPNSIYIAEKSTPVISFGNFEKAKIGTLGINPSSNEFFNKDKLLSQEKKRLIDLETLKLQSHEQITEDKAHEILDGCYNYFKKRPLEWFDDFEELLNEKSFSYKDGSASHIDLVQWCTKPVWGEIPSIEQEKLLESDKNFFHWQLSNNNMEVIILGGRQVLNQVAAIPDVNLELIDKYYYYSGSRKISFELYKMENFKGRKLLGWSVNLQTMRSKAEEKTGVFNVLKSFIKAEI
jgi:hypothetical protein